MFPSLLSLWNMLYRTMYGIIQHVHAVSLLMGEWVLPLPPFANPAGTLTVCTCGNWQEESSGFGLSTLLTHSSQLVQLHRLSVTFCSEEQLNIHIHTHRYMHEQSRA